MDSAAAADGYAAARHPGFSRAKLSSVRERQGNPHVPHKSCVLGRVFVLLACVCTAYEWPGFCAPALMSLLSVFWRTSRHCQARAGDSSLAKGGIGTCVGQVDIYFRPRAHYLAHFVLVHARLSLRGTCHLNQTRGRGNKSHVQGLRTT